MRFPLLAPEVPWFVVLPDTPVPGEVLDALLDRAAHNIAYASGRPWLVGNWPEHHAVVAVEGTSRVALIGHSSVTQECLAHVTQRLDDVTSLDSVLSSAAGSYHVVATARDRLRVQGTASGVRRVFHGRLKGQVVASDRVDVLAAVLDAEIDLRAVALSLLDPMRPHPLDDVPMWQGVSPVPADRYLLVGVNGRPRNVQWWHAPEPVLTLELGARKLASALSDAVRTRLRGPEVASFDLSGGVDSTAVAFLAAREPTRFVAYTATAYDPADDDLAWARMAMGELPGVVHDVLPSSALPLAYHGISTASDDLDEPCVGVVDRAKLLTAYGRLARRGSTVHLTGYGGDEVLEAAPNHLHSLARSDLVDALKLFRAVRLNSRWPVLPSMRTVLRSEPYSAWLHEVSGRLSGDHSRRTVPDLEWEVTPRLPPWVTEDARALVLDSFRELGGSIAPLASPRGRHADLSAIRGSARFVRSVAQLVAPTGLPMAAPFLDDRVIEACLSVDPMVRLTPWRYKALLNEAMRDTVPDHLRARTTKADCSADEEAGIRNNRADLLALCADSQLARLGFVDADQLRAGCRYSLGPQRLHEPLQQTMACEVWLRRVIGRGTVEGQR
ncbi:asparagine synthase-related protein [Kutzneria albida]|uniref:asparagine synthase (glutamine-hydrolyzing) n=1 Tax=Kutzneria albida DSM 43870 TaxID=1449976 RepID=W5WFM2_9PSEU|nr:asparagine synthase-related protein [Kutzneria albida]AHH96969.1 asparagine synthase [Kutzneria albida DSM 43870]